MNTIKLDSSAMSSVGIFWHLIWLSSNTDWNILTEILEKYIHVAASGFQDLYRVNVILLVGIGVRRQLLLPLLGQVLGMMVWF